MTEPLSTLKVSGSRRFGGVIRHTRPDAVSISAHIRPRSCARASAVAMCCTSRSTSRNAAAQPASSAEAIGVERASVSASTHAMQMRSRPRSRWSCIGVRHRSHMPAPTSQRSITAPSGPARRRCLDSLTGAESGARLYAGVSSDAAAVDTMLPFRCWFVDAIRAAANCDTCSSAARSYDHHSMSTPDAATRPFIASLLSGLRTTSTVAMSVLPPSPP